jgi:hypothetical protein
MVGSVWDTRRARKAGAAQPQPFGSVRACGPSVARGASRLVHSTMSNLTSGWELHHRLRIDVLQGPREPARESPRGPRLIKVPRRRSSLGGDGLPAGTRWGGTRRPYSPSACVRVMQITFDRPSDPFQQDRRLHQRPSGAPGLRSIRHASSIHRRGLAGYLRGSKYMGTSMWQ